MRPVQFFSDEYLDQCKRMKPADVLRFLDEFRRLYAPPRPPTPTCQEDYRCPYGAS